MKTCSKCKTFKPLTDFTKDKGQKDGFYSSCKICKRQYYYSNSSAIREHNSNYQKNNKEKIAKYQATYRKLKIKKDINYKLAMSVRHRLNIALKQKAKSGSAVDLLGCSVDELKSYLESKWEVGMNWENHSRFGWHIDHIQPLSSFDLTDKEQLKIACNYKNLQPLWWRDNLVKSNKNMETL